MVKDKFAELILGTRTDLIKDMVSPDNPLRDAAIKHKTKKKKER